MGQTQEKATFDVASALSGMKTKTDTKTKSKTPTIDDREHYAIVEAVVKAKKVLDDAEAKFDIAKANMVNLVKPLYDKNKGLKNSYKFLGGDGLNATVIWKDMFTKVDSENRDRIVAIVGDNFDNFFEDLRIITMTDTSDETITMLMKTLGDRFSEIFEVKLAIGCQSGMITKQYDLPDEAKIYVNQYKPSVRCKG